jgi:hypothetical protein
MSKRFHDAAKNIQSATGIRVEYAECNREYVVDGTMAGSTARQARAMANRILRNEPRGERAAIEARSGH